MPDSPAPTISTSKCSIGMGRKLRAGSKERAGFGERLASFGNPTMKQLPDVRHRWPDFQLDADAGALRAFSQPARIVEQRFVLADMNEQRRQAAKVRVKRRC